MIQRVNARAAPQQADPTHAQGMIVIDHVLAAQGANDGRLDSLREGEQFGPRIAAADTGENHRALRVDQKRYRLLALSLIGQDLSRPRKAVQAIFIETLDLLPGKIGWKRDMGDTLLRDRRPARCHEQVGHLIDRGDLLVEDGYVGKQVFCVDLLVIFRTDITGRNLTGDRNHRRVVHLGIVQPVEQVNRARAGCSHAGSQVSCQFRLS